MRRGKADTLLSAVKHKPQPEAIAAQATITRKIIDAVDRQLSGNEVSPMSAMEDAVLLPQLVENGYSQFSGVRPVTLRKSRTL